MSNDILATFRVGADISVALDALQGDPSLVTEITGRIRSVQILSDDTLHFTDAAVADMVVAERAAEGDDPAGWNLTLTGAESAKLPEGLYGVDAKLTASGGTTITSRTALVELTEAAIE